MKWAFLIFAIVVLIAAYLFIYLTVKINGMEAEIRDKSSEIDGNLWDRAFQLSKLAEIIMGKGIETDMDVLDVNTFGLGMSVTMQAVNAEKMDESDVKIREILKEHADLKKNEDFATHLQKFNNSRAELMKASLAYNKCVNKFNSYTSNFPVNIIMIFHKKQSKGNFAYYFRDLEVSEAPANAESE